jgi:translation initiation factor 2 subunit 3
VPPYMIVIRSFDVNKPGEDAETLRGGVAGGTILKGCLRVGEEIAIRPGYITRNTVTGLTNWTEIRSQITTLKADENHLMYAVPGGLLAVGMKVDPQFTRSDNMVGMIIGHPNAMPQVFIEIDVKTTFLKRIVGTKDDQSGKNNKVDHIKVGEILLINISSTSCGGTVIKVEDVSLNVQLTYCFIVNGAYPIDEACMRKHSG